jgi:hypothetical protein
MKIVFGTGYGAVTLGDDVNKPTIEIESWAAVAAILKEPTAASLAGGGLFLATLQNISSPFTFVATESFGTADEAYESFVAALSLAGQQLSLAVTITSQVITYPAAVLQKVERLPAPRSNGVRLAIRYTFEATTFSIA